MNIKEYLTSQDIISVKGILYKPFWFDKHMYFVNIYTGFLFKSESIYLGDSDKADLSQLKNYFQENNIKVINAEFALSKNFKI